MDFSPIKNTSKSSFVFSVSQQHGAEETIKLVRQVGFLIFANDTDKQRFQEHQEKVKREREARFLENENIIQSLLQENLQQGITSLQISQTAIFEPEEVIFETAKAIFEPEEVIFETKEEVVLERDQLLPRNLSRKARRNLLAKIM